MEKTTNEEKLTTVGEVTPENSTEFSLQIILEDEHDQIIKQEILDIATHHAVRSYKNGVFTHPNGKILRNFQYELMSKDINCQFIFKSPNPLKI